MRSGGYKVKENCISMIVFRGEYIVYYSHFMCRGYEFLCGEGGKIFCISKSCFSGILFDNLTEESNGYEVIDSEFGYLV